GAVSLAGSGAGADLELVEEGGGGRGHGVDRVVEGRGIVAGGGAETADLPDVLQGGGPDVLVGDLLGVRRAEGLDASAHASDRTLSLAYVSPRRPSRPMVRPGGRVASPRAASSTPGMNEDRSRESCLIVSVSPVPPKSTSWWATRPADRTEWTRTSSTLAPRAPGRDDAVASGGTPRPPAARAAAMMDAVRSAVPDGASALFAWCSSMTSAESKNLAAWAAKRIIKMAPTEKFGTTRTRTLPCSASQPRTSSMRSSAN